MLLVTCSGLHLRCSRFGCVCLLATIVCVPLFECSVSGVLLGSVSWCAPAERSVARCAYGGCTLVHSLRVLCWGGVPWLGAVMLLLREVCWLAHDSVWCSGVFILSAVRCTAGGYRVVGCVLHSY